MQGTGPVAAPAAALSPQATTALLQRLTLCADPEALSGLKVEGLETWAAAGHEEPNEEETDQVVYYRSVPIEVEETQNHRRLSAAAQRREQEHLHRLEQAVDRAAAMSPAAVAAGQLVNLEGEIWTVAQFEAQFRWTAVVSKDGLVELSFVPAPPRRPASRLERLLSRTAGSLTVDAESGQVEGGEFHSLEAVWFGAGIIAHFARFSGQFAMQPAGKCWVMQRVMVEIAGRELFHRIHGTETMIYSVRDP